jgi:hypothetical protein
VEGIGLIPHNISILSLRASGTPAPGRPSGPEMLPLSGMGITSLVMAIFSLLNILLFILVARAVRGTFHGPDELESPLNYFLGSWMLGIGLVCVTGIVFGIGGVCQANRRRSVATLGLCLNIGIPIGMMFIMLLLQTLRYPAERGEIAQATPDIDTIDPAAWRSPFARTMQCVTLGMAGGLVAFYGRKRGARVGSSAVRVGSSPVRVVASVNCRGCRKQMPATARFCRRCGAAMVAPAAGGAQSVQQPFP